MDGQDRLRKRANRSAVIVDGILYMPRSSPHPPDEYIPESSSLLDELVSTISKTTPSWTQLPEPDTSRPKSRNYSKTISIAHLQELVHLQKRSIPEDRSFCRRVVEAIKYQLDKWQKRDRRQERYERTFRYSSSSPRSSMSSVQEPPTPDSTNSPDPTNASEHTRAEAFLNNDSHDPTGSRPDCSHPECQHYFDSMVKEIEMVAANRQLQARNQLRLFTEEWNRSYETLKKQYLLDLQAQSPDLGRYRPVLTYASTATQTHHAEPQQRGVSRPHLCF